MRVAIFEYHVTSTSPVGSCILQTLRDLCQESEFTVFAAKFENPCPERIRFVRVPVPMRPLALLFLAYHLLAPLCYWIERLRNRVKFDLVVMVESNLAFGDVSYAHFCHRAYLACHWSQARTTGVRGMLRWIDHWLRALLEPWVYRRVRYIVVPSRGLERELESLYPFTKGKLVCIPNPVDSERLCSPGSFDRTLFRAKLGLTADQLALVFVALGHFERKGLPLLFRALARIRDAHLRVVVVGGEPDLIAAYREQAHRVGLGDHVLFVGRQSDVRPYLWMADGFVLPSVYETFSLVTFEAAAAGLPLIATPVYGVEEILHDGCTGIVIDPTANGLTYGLSRFLALSSEERQALGQRAQHQVRAYDKKQFVASWRTFYSQCQREGAEATPAPKWLVLGHYGGHNTGDDAMLLGLAAASGPSQRKQMVVVTKDGALPLYLANTGVRAIPARPRAVLAELRHAHGIVVGGGTHFHDDYIGWRYLRHTRYMLWFVGIALLTKLLRKQVLWLSMGFGPFFRNPTRWLTRIGLRVCDYVTVRDEQSYRDIARWIAPARMALTFDLAALLIGRESGAVGWRRPRDSAARKTGILGISATSVQHSKTGGPEVDALFWDRFGQSLVTLLTDQPHVRVRFFVIRGGTRDDDTALTALLSHRLALHDAARVEVVPYDANPTATLGKIAECDAFVATRFHSGVLAYLSGCPLLFLTYHRKVFDLAKEIGLSEQACLPLCATTTEAMLLTKLTELLIGADHYRPTLPVSDALARARLNLEVFERASRGLSLGLGYAESVSHESV